MFHAMVDGVGKFLFRSRSEPSLLLNVIFTPLNIYPMPDTPPPQVSKPLSQAPRSDAQGSDVNSLNGASSAPGTTPASLPLPPTALEIQRLLLIIPTRPEGGYLQKHAVLQWNEKMEAAIVRI
jgi:hypothetical protein